uniref:Uncharacterized protein n=1 Tax=Arundo donax TaxID=35708 RepID=A0A0A8XZH1_ARUDO
MPNSHASSVVVSNTCSWPLGHRITVLL